MPSWRGGSRRNFHPYEESEISRAQGKLLQYYEKMKDGQRQSEEDRQVLQELVSDISHQVKTPTANIVMFAEILRSHSADGGKTRGISRHDGSSD